MRSWVSARSPLIAGTLGYLRLPEQVNPEGLSNGSQFFMTMEDVPDISGVFSAFGQVIEGMDVAAQIAEGDTIEQIVITEAADEQGPHTCAAAHRNDRPHTLRT